MQAIILAAGEGSRMRPLTARVAKVMLPLAGRPLLEHIVLRAKEAGIDRFVLVVGYAAGSVRDHFQDGRRLGVKIDYAIQAEQLGTAHALMAAESLASEQFMVLNGDVIPDIDALKELAKKEMAVSAFRVDDPRRYGVFLLQNGIFQSVVEKSDNPPSNLANAGIYLFKRWIFDELRALPRSSRGEYELTDGLNRAAKREAVEIVELKRWLEIGRPWDILEANAALLPEVEPRILGEVEAGATLKGRVSIGKGTVVRSGSYIVGPVLIGQDSDIGPNCYIRPACCIGDNVRIGNAVEIKNSAIMNGSKIGHLSYVGDSVIGEGCNLGAGTICSNLRHDKGSIKSYLKGEKTDSGRRKLGVIMGHEVMTGINTSIYPGTVIEPSYWGRPAEVIRGHCSSERAFK
ncbi:bifunctional sugar-1-phosphate nucleotidylyltransferase/acetyltransferase [Methanothrix sp.]|jgi:UDP-N-acetylglucosamine diphosphorylase/glucosamine-1-phosphate N-acetyltransferase|uniref:bifunctional sugar-1-phosphate nucleotidylyltransferase/acetyltransferase n=1 Tax=Methanothrix sp. TaxID=90426 RepID=UPI001BD5BB1C